MKNVLVLAIGLYFLCASVVEAVTITVTNSPTSISSDPFTLDVSVDGADPSTNYLRIDLYKKDTANYFGETFTGSDWYGGSEGIKYFPIDISKEGTASGSVRGRIGSPDSKEYIGPGQYKLRIRRYTKSGSPATNDKQNPVDLEITVPTPSPTYTPTVTSVPTPTRTPTATSAPTPTKTPTPTTTAKATSTPIPTANPQLSSGDSDLSQPPSIDPSSVTKSQLTTASGETLGSSVDPSPEEAQPSPQAVLSKPVPFIPIALVGTGLILVGIGIGPLVVKYLRR
jgi:hypothetical protein